MRLLDILLGNNQKKPNDLFSKKEDKDKKIETDSLEDWQKKLVKKGEYNAWNFEEDGDLEDDDYYNEDDNE